MGEDVDVAVPLDDGIRIGDTAFRLVYERIRSVPKVHSGTNAATRLEWCEDGNAKVRQRVEVEIGLPPLGNGSIDAGFGCYERTNRNRVVSRLHRD